MSSSLPSAPGKAMPIGRQKFTKTPARFRLSLLGFQPFRNKWLLVISGLLVFFLGVGFSVPDSTPSSPVFFSCPYTSAVYLAPHPVLPVRATVAAVVPHHLIAYTLIDRTLAQVAPGVTTVLLLGPNHPNQGQHQIQTTLRTWTTPFGRLAPDTRLIRRLLAENLAAVDDFTLAREHSVCGLVPFVKKYFPSARVVPLAVKSFVSPDAQRDLGLFLARNCRACLLLSSVDFSHDLAPQAAASADEVSSDVLTGLHLDRLNDITADSRPSLGILMWYVTSRGLTSGQLVGRTDANSVLKINQPTVTSYLGIVYSR